MAEDARQAAALTPGALDQYTGGDKDVEKEIYGQFLESSRNDADKLAVAFGGDDIEAVMHAAHRIKGASRMVGATPMAEVAERIEMAARKGDWDTLRANRTAFEQELARLVAELQTLT